VAHDVGRDRTDDSFDFGKFRHSLGKFDEDAAFANGDGIALQLNIGIEIIHAAEAIECPGMPGTNDLAAIDIAIAQRTAGVWAQTIKAAEFAGVVAEGVDRTVEVNLFQRAGRELGERFDFDERHLELG
jgi:hypothetical protein